MTEEEFPSIAAELLDKLRSRREKIVTAESCTAGLVADLFASIPGASDVFWGSFITYSADAKVKLLGVAEETLKQHGEVSCETAIEMAQGALVKSGADCAVSVTGLAGPGGDSSGTPIGTVWFGLAKTGAAAEAVSFHFTEARNVLRKKAAVKALEELLRYIGTKVS